MTKAEYLETLKIKLDSFQPSVKAEILADYEEHFSSGLQSGKSEAMLCEELGDIDDFISELRQFYPLEPTTSDQESGNAAPEQASSSAAHVNTETAETAQANTSDDAQTEQSTASDDTQTEQSTASDDTQTEQSTASGDQQTEQATGNTNSHQNRKPYEEYHYGFDLNNVIDVAISAAKNGLSEASRALDSILGRAIWHGEEDAAQEADAQAKENDFCETENQQPAQALRSTKTECVCKKAVLDAFCADVTVRPSQDQQFRLYYENNSGLKEQMLYYIEESQTDDTYFCRLNKRAGQSGYFQWHVAPKLRFTLEIPEDFQLLELKTTSGDINISDLTDQSCLSINSASGCIHLYHIQADEVVLRAKSGDLTCDDLSVKRLVSETGSGDLEAENCDIATLTCSTASGDMELRNCDLDTLNSNTASGDMTLTDIDCTRLQAATKSGDLTLSDCHSDYTKLSVISGDLEVTGLVAKELCADSVSGEVSLQLDSALCTVNSISGDQTLQLAQDCTCTLHSTSGDISLLLAHSKGYTSHSSTVSGEVSLRYENEAHSGKGQTTFGTAASKLTLTTVTGDIKVNAYH